MKQKQFGELIVIVGVYLKSICQQYKSNTSNIIRLRLCSLSSYCCSWIQTDLLSKHRMTSSWLRRSLAFILFGMLFHMSTKQRLTFLSTYTTLVRAYHNQIFDFFSISSRPSYVSTKEIKQNPFHAHYET